MHLPYHLILFRPGDPSGRNLEDAQRKISNNLDEAQLDFSLSLGICSDSRYNISHHDRDGVVKKQCKWRNCRCITWRSEDQEFHRIYRRHEARLTMFRGGLRRVFHPIA